MNIVVLGGSPKCAKSITMQYVNYLKVNNKDHNFVEYYIASNIGKIEQDKSFLEKIMSDIKNADTILWAFPLYFGLVNGQYKRFIEIIFENNTGALHGKHCAILATSIHFFDHTAIEYIRGISEDLGMIVDEVHSAVMDDLLKESGKEQFELFFKEWIKKVENNLQAGRLSAPINWEPTSFSYDKNNLVSPRTNIKLGLVTESGNSENLDTMVDAFSKEFAEIEIFDLSEIKIAGGCLGCLKCGYDNKCVYEGKDDVIDVYRKLKECDVIVFCGTVKDRYLSSIWKTFIDRMFFTTHIPFFSGKIIAFIISGPLRQHPNLRDLLTGFFETHKTTVGGFVTDEDYNTIEQIQGLATTLESYHKNGYRPPCQFLGDAGHRIFRDEIYAGLKGIFVADHKYYQKHSLYDFPQKKLKKRILSTIMYGMLKIPFIRENIQQNMADYMIKPYKIKS